MIKLAQNKEGEQSMLADPMSGEEYVSPAKYEIIAGTTEKLTQLFSNNFDCDGRQDIEDDNGCGCLIVPLMMISILLFCILISAGH